MFYRAFKHHLKHRFKNQYSIAGLTIGAMLSSALAMFSQPLFFAITGRYLVTHNNVGLAAAIYLLMIVNMPAVLGVVSAFLYCLKFYGNYEVIERYFGYRAFRITREQQDYFGLRFEGCTKEERIIGSAIMDTAGTMWCVLRPGRHFHNIAHAAEHGANKQLRQQGFLTNRYRFIGREAARSMAMANGQVLDPDHDRDLFSEDLWDTPKHLQYKG